MDTKTNAGSANKEGTCAASSDVGAADKRAKKGRRLVVAAVISFVLGCVLLTINGEWRVPLFGIGFLFFSLVLAPVLGIIATIVLFRTMKPLGHVFSVFLILFLSVVSLVHGRYFVVCLLPYIYTPPALTSENLRVYRACIAFTRKHNEHESLTLLRRGWLSVSPNGYGHYHVSHTGLRELFSEDERTEIIGLVRQLRAVRCHTLRRHKDMVLFYKARNSFLPAYPEEFLSLFPRGPGVLYSLNGENPNQIDSEVFNAGKPFVKIAGNWYLSRRLMLVGLRPDTQVSIPKSLIDHSLRIGDLKLDDRPIEEKSS